MGRLTVSNALDILGKSLYRIRSTLKERGRTEMNNEARQKVLEVLQGHHEATATKDVDTLRTLFVPSAQFIGTDDTEKMLLEEYVNYLEDTESGWDMRECLERQVLDIIPAYGNAVGFFEVVKHQEYGLMRGSGVLVRDLVGNWRISIYVLSFSVPNHVVDTLDGHFKKLLTSS